jgi:hypothetical protein
LDFIHGVINKPRQQQQTQQVPSCRVSTKGCTPTADFLFFPCSALLFSAELPVLRVSFALFPIRPPPLYRDLQVGALRPRASG